MQLNSAFEHTHFDRNWPPWSARGLHTPHMYGDPLPSPAHKAAAAPLRTGIGAIFNASALRSTRQLAYTLRSATRPPFELGPHTRTRSDMNALLASQRCAFRFTSRKLAGAYDVSWLLVVVCVCVSGE